MKNRLLTRPLALFLLLALVLALGAPVLAQDDDLPVIQWTDCPFALPDGETEGETLDCGYLITYEDHFDETASQRVELAFVILYGEQSTSDPVLYLEGGPGGSPLSSVDEWAESSIRAERDLILIDQRGTGYSTPSLNCIEVETDEGDDALLAEQACFDRMVDEGITIATYNSAQSAADIADLMRLLQGEIEYSEYNLLGISYGTRLALTLLRDNPEGIRSVILDSVYPPNRNAYERQGVNQYRGLQMLFDGCAADPDCDAAYPDLENVFYQTYVALNDSPGVYEAEDADTGEVSEEELTGDSLLDAIIEALYSTSAIPELPLVIYEVSEGNYEVVGQIDSGELSGNFSRQDDAGDISDSEGVFNAVECREELPFNSFDEAVAASAIIPEPIHDYLVSQIENMFLVCQIYGIEPADAVETDAVYSDVPTLVLAGDYDPITPPEDAQLAAESLSSSYYFEFPGFGHGVTDSGDCANSIISQFLADPTVEPDGSCIAELDGPAFIIR